MVFARASISMATGRMGYSTNCVGIVEIARAPFSFTKAGPLVRRPDIIGGKKGRLLVYGHSESS